MMYFWIFSLPRLARAKGDDGGGGRTGGQRQRKANESHEALCVRKGNPMLIVGRRRAVTGRSRGRLADLAWISGARW